ncbi:hypothetical protein P691DRAFT_763674 [Macrolepiota fuliginosa MF-IS2]|uniref:Uncharacterized protein n=1 Tax=Macrolepiota fuliginosa MF-IS2 TaxID=1400762 RepID=A0A9P6BXL1_9AGAR|nr:hypothetical protein P691DRAFT_763674 [Macrolepiota fuliginosa MF-IS2]
MSDITKGYCMDASILHVLVMLTLMWPVGFISHVRGGEEEEDTANNSWYFNGSCYYTHRLYPADFVGSSD